MPLKERKGSLKNAHDRVTAMPKPEQRAKRRGGGQIVGTTIRWDSESWQAIHDMAIKERVSINTLLLNAVNLYRREQGLPALKPVPTKKELVAELE